MRRFLTRTTGLVALLVAACLVALVTGHDAVGPRAQVAQADCVEIPNLRLTVYVGTGRGPNVQLAGTPIEVLSTTCSGYRGAVTATATLASDGSATVTVPFGLHLMDQNLNPPKARVAAGAAPALNASLAALGYALAPTPTWSDVKIASVRSSGLQMAPDETAPPNPQMTVDIFATTVRLTGTTPPTSTTTAPPTTVPPTTRHISPGGPTTANPPRPVPPTAAPVPTSEAATAPTIPSSSTSVSANASSSGATPSTNESANASPSSEPSSPAAGSDDSARLPADRRSHERTVGSVLLLLALLCLVAAAYGISRR